MSNTELNKYSKTLTQDPTQPATQAHTTELVLPKKISAKHKLVLQVLMGYDGNIQYAISMIWPEIVKDGVKKKI